MKIIKKILMGFGVFFLLIIGIFVLLAKGSNDFKEDNSVFVTKYIQDYSKQWNTEDVVDRTAVDLLEGITSAEGRQALALFATLGELERAGEFTINNYTTKTGDIESAILSFKGYFEKSVTIVKVGVTVEKGDRKVHSLFIEPINNWPVAETEINI